MNLTSPDRTRVYTMKDGEALWQLAQRAYGDGRLWRAIAEANDLDRPRFVPTGTVLKVPAL
jgi:nucleoid-associated protein YgaU